ncbi:ABC transporter permease [Serinibacter arcticus]|uniref:ABC-type multidrug transport system, permease component n=1 Tax=Serinibacter arcticus TaxID=1655435 RepID=A0A4Z1E1P0_9MICO|nr:ABC transporter permease [Serinibacter arcticus]TGO04938.1 ABC-type multidrug transport system, permease component [Serinibacter arcticus]
MNRVLTYARFEAVSALRNGEQLLISIILPALVLIGLGRSGVVELDLLPGQDRLDVVVPGVLGLAVLSSAFTSQAIATAFDRRWGVLRQLATTPLGARGIVAGKVLSVFAVQVVQVVALGALGLALGWRPEVAGVPGALLVGVLGSVAFTSLGLLIAGTLRAEAVLAVANLLWVLLLVGGGLVLPAATFSSGLAVVTAWLPSGAMGDALRLSLTGGGFDVVAAVVLAAWSGVLTALAAKLFRPTS